MGARARTKDGLQTLKLFSTYHWARAICALTVLGMAGFGLVSCLECDPNPPTRSPTKQPAGSFDATAAMEVADPDGVCMNVPHGMGSCESSCVGSDCGDPCRVFAWFCSDDRLYLLDCTDIISGGICIEERDTWLCGSELLEF